MSDSRPIHCCRDRFSSHRFPARAAGVSAVSAAFAAAALRHKRTAEEAALAIDTFVLTISRACGACLSRRLLLLFLHAFDRHPYTDALPFSRSIRLHSSRSCPCG